MSKVTKSSSCVINDLNVSHQNPCDELETVRKEYRWGYDQKWRPYGPLFDDERRETRELVTRQNAEAIIAAERVEKEKLEAAWLEAEGIISDLKADNEAKNREIESITKSLIIEEQLNAAKDARIKELEGEVFYDQVLGITWKQACEQCNRECAHYQQNAEALEADNKRLREALERITDWPDGGKEYGQVNIKHFARTALGEDGSHDL